VNYVSQHNLTPGRGLNKQCVEINTLKKGIYVSSTKKIEHGVAQGSILGPVLFSLYIKDLPLNITGTKIVLSADDTTY
jgi:hypothetical protein